MSEEESEAPKSEEKEKAPAQKSGVPWVTLIIVLLVTPIVTIIAVEFVMVPKLKSSLQGDSAPKAEKKEESKDEDKGKEKGEKTYELGNTFKFEGLVTNLAGTMGSRFLKATFEVVSEDVEMHAMIQKKQSQVQDAVTGVMSTRNLRELEAIGGRNQLRVSLIEAINKALGISIVEELYFIELIVQ